MQQVFLVIIAVLLFGFIIFIHELGHFVTAKLSGIRVNEFALGMGPIIFSFGKGETKYALRLLPIGGSCTMEGEDDESSDDGAFNKKPVWKRMLVVVMGAVMNVLLGLILMMVILGQEPKFASTTISQFQEGSAMQAAGLQTGDRFTAIDGYAVNTDRDLLFALGNGLIDYDKVKIEVKRDDKPLVFENVKLQTTLSDGKAMPVLDFAVFPIEKNIGTLITQSAKGTVSTVRMVWFSLWGLVTGQYGFSEVAGPVGAATAIGQVASAGLEQNFMAAVNNILFMMMIITVNLGVVNLLPIPALDGGRLFFLLIEAIRRKPIPAKYEGWVHAAGFALLMAVMVIVTFSDIVRLVTGKGLGG